MSTYYVKPASQGGSDSNDGTTFALAKATLLSVYTTCGTGDTIRVCSNSTTPLECNGLTITAAKNAIRFIGCDLINGTPYDGSDYAHIKPPDGNAYVFEAAAGGYTECHLFKDLALDGVNGLAIDGFKFNNYFHSGIVFQNVKFINCRYGINSYLYHVIKFCLLDCMFLDCTHGINADNDSSLSYEISLTIVNTLFNRCTCGIRLIRYNDTTVRVRGKIDIISCRFINGSNAIILEGGSYLWLFKNVFHNNSADAIYIETTNFPSIDVCRNNIFCNNGGYAINASAGGSVNGRYYVYMDYNCFYNNASGNVNAYFNGGVLPGEHNVISNPLFSSIVEGSEDFSLRSNSPCISAGIGFTGGK